MKIKTTIRIATALAVASSALLGVSCDKIESKISQRTDYENYLVFSNGWKLSGCKVPVPPYTEWPNYSYVTNAPDNANPNGWWPNGYLEWSKKPRTVQVIELQ
jgi:hypothetical protein